MAFWGIKLRPGKPCFLELEDDRGRLHVSQATLGAGTSDKKTIVQCVVGDKEPISLCSLFPERLETCPLNIEFEEDEEVTFLVKGGHHVYLSGFFLGQSKDYEHGYDFDAYEDGLGESDSDSDYRVYDSEEDDFEDSDLDMYPSSPVRNSGVRIEEIVEDTNLSDENGTDKRPKKKRSGLSEGSKNSEQQIVVKSNINAVESEDEDGFPISTSPKEKTEAEINEPKSQEKDNETAGKTQSVKRKIDAAGETSKVESVKQTKKNKKENATVREETGLKSPMPSNDADVNYKEKAPAAEKPEIKNNEKTTNESAKQMKKRKKGNVTGREETDLKSTTPSNVAEVNDKEQSPAAEIKNSEKTTNESEMEKKKNEKKKKKKHDTQVHNDGQQSGGKEVQSSMEVDKKSTTLRTYPNGLIIEELSMGKPDGKRAASGKKVKVHYIGKLQKNGKIFDSNVGRAPFQFRLGIGEVIKGWDVGVIGMRVGDKRRLTIPPAMGYGNKGAPPTIPPNSWLVFDVELVDAN